MIHCTCIAISAGHLSLFDVLLFVDFGQTKFALLLIKGACSGVVVRLFFWLDTPLHIIPSLATECMSKNTDVGCQFLC